MINRVVLVGRLTKDPMLRKTQNGTSVASFTLACNRRVAADQQPQADFINCVVWNKQADNLAHYQRKGSLVGVEGRIQTRSYDENGRRVFVTEVFCESIQYLERKNDLSSNGQYQNTGYAQAYSNNPSAMNNGYDNSQASNYNSEPGTEFDNIDYYRDSINISTDDLPF